MGVPLYIGKNPHAHWNRNSIFSVLALLLWSLVSSRFCCLFSFSCRKTYPVKGGNMWWSGLNLSFLLHGGKRLHELYSVAGMITKFAAVMATCMSRLERAINAGGKARWLLSFLWFEPEDTCNCADPVKKCCEEAVCSQLIWCGNPDQSGWGSIAAVATDWAWSKGSQQPLLVEQCWTHHKPAESPAKVAKQCYRML